MSAVTQQRRIATLRRDQLRIDRNRTCHAGDGGGIRGHVTAAPGEEAGQRRLGEVSLVLLRKHRHQAARDFIELLLVGRSDIIPHLQRRLKTALRRRIRALTRLERHAVDIDVVADSTDPCRNSSA